MTDPSPPVQRRGSASGTDVVVAALRDASFVRDTGRLSQSRIGSYIPVYHVVKADSPYYESRCGRLLAPFTEVDAVGAVYRCQRPGCKQGWPKNDA